MLKLQENRCYLLETLRVFLRHKRQNPGDDTTSTFPGLRGLCGERSMFLPSAKQGQRESLSPTQCPQPAVPTTPLHRTERSPKESKEQGKHRTFAEVIPRSLWASGIFLASYKLPGVCVS